MRVVSVGVGGLAVTPSRYGTPKADAAKRKQSDAPESAAGAASGTGTANKVRTSPAPEMRAASSSDESMRESAATVGRNTSGNPAMPSTKLMPAAP